MSGFTRSAAGLANAHLLYKVDFVIYTEGNSQGGTPCGDIGFWRAVFHVYAPAAKCKFIAKGSRSEVDKVAAALTLLKNHKSICTYDRDYRDLQGHSLPGPCCMTTYGYSYENDLCDVDNIVDAIEHTYPGDFVRGHAVTFFAQERMKIQKALKWCSVADQQLGYYHSTFYNRKALKFCEIFSPFGADDVPAVDPIKAINVLKDRIKNKGPKMALPYYLVDFDFWRRLYGHLNWWLHFRFARNYLRRLGVKGTINESLFLGCVIQAFKTRLPTNGQLALHYQDAVGTAMASAI